MPSHHRPRRTQQRRAARDIALDRRADAHHELRRRSAAAPCRWRSGSNATALRLGDRVATLAWNSWRHLESWYGILGIGAVYHTVNPRLFTDQIVWIVNHAEDRVIMTDVTFLPLLEKIADRIPTIERTIVYCEAAAHAGRRRCAMPCPTRNGLPRPTATSPGRAFDENTAAGMCYTSGTTGNPKGVVYSHRSNVLHAMTALRPDMIGLSGRDIALPVVPLFHANGWAIGFAAPMAGAALVLPGQSSTAPRSINC